MNDDYVNIKKLRTDSSDEVTARDYYGDHIKIVALGSCVKMTADQRYYVFTAEQARKFAKVLKRAAKELEKRESDG